MVFLGAIVIFFKQKRTLVLICISLLLTVNTVSKRVCKRFLPIVLVTILLSFICQTSALCANNFPTKMKNSADNLSVSPQSGILLNAKEKTWLQAHKLINVGTIQYPPLIYMNKSSSLEGISADYLKLISEKTGLVFKAEYLAWSDLMKQSKAMGIDLFSGLKNPDQVKSLNFTKPYLHNSYVVSNRLKTFFFSKFSSCWGR